MRTPAAEIQIDRELVARLIEAQHPDLAAPLTPVANGWDNAIFRLGERLCVRLPRRRVAVELILKEHRFLPRLAAALPVDIPVPLRVGEPSALFPWPWTISPWLDGTVAADVQPAGRTGIAAELAEFLACLHTRALADAPHNPVRGGPLRSRSVVTLQRLEQLDGATAERRDELRDLWLQLANTPAWAGPPLWLHGDLHPANFLLDPVKRLRAVLDFGDLTAGDPATDLAVAWLAFEPSARSTFHDRLNELVGIDADSWQRARGWALSLATAFVQHSDDQPRMRAIGDHALRQVLLDE